MEWLDLLTTRDAFVDTDRTRPLAEYIIEVLYGKDHVNSCDTEVRETPVIEKEDTIWLGDIIIGIELNAVGDQYKNDEPDENSKNFPTNNGNTPKDIQRTHMSETSRTVVRSKLDVPADPGDDSIGSDDSDRSSRPEGHHGGECNNEPKEGYRGLDPAAIQTKGRQGQSTEQSDDHYNMGLGWNGRDLVKDFTGQQPYSGRYEENLDEVLDVYGELA